MNATASTIESIDKQLTGEKNKKLKELIADKKAILVTKPDSCSSDSSSCSLSIVLGKDVCKKEKCEYPFPITSVMKNTIVQELNNYVSNLNAIVNSETIGAITTSVSEALVSAATIEKTLAKMKDPDVEPAALIEKYNSPVMASMKWLVSQYIDRVKIRALAAATKRAQPVIEGLSKYYKTISESAIAIEKSDALKAFSQAQMDYDGAEKKDDQSILAYTRAAATFDTVLRAATSEPMGSFLNAHTKLNDSLNGDASLSEAIKVIKDFKKQADELKKIMEDFKSV